HLAAEQRSSSPRSSVSAPRSPPSPRRSVSSRRGDGRVLRLLNNWVSNIGVRIGSDLRIHRSPAGVVQLASIRLGPALISLRPSPSILGSKLSQAARAWMDVDQRVEPLDARF